MEAKAAFSPHHTVRRGEVLAHGIKIHYQDEGYQEDPPFANVA